MYFLEKQLKKYQTFTWKSDIPGTYKFHCKRNNFSETSPNSIFFKFCSKDWLFLKISTKLQIESLQFHDLMLLRRFDACFDSPNLCRFYSSEALLSKENLRIRIFVPKNEHSFEHAFLLYLQ